MELKQINATLLILEQGNKVLLGKKKRGFAKGTYNAIGGKQELGETINQTMIRETQEEIGITPVDYKKTGLINFDTWYKGEHSMLNLHIYTCPKYLGQIIETDEMIPEWFDKDKIPYDQMLEDDKLWFDKVINNQCILGKVVLSKELKTLSCEINIVPNDYFDHNDNMTK